MSSVKGVNCRVLDWKEIQKNINIIERKIKNDGFHPEYIVAIARGGVIPARLLCDALHLKNFISIKASHWGITATKEGNAVLNHGTTVDLSDKKVLLVDDITDTGQSMMVCKKYLEELGPAQVRTVALFHLKGSEFVPDYYGGKEEWVWMIWPWNYKEDLVNLTKKLLDAGINSVDKIVNGLREHFNVRADEDEITSLLEHMNYLRKQEIL